MCSLINKQLLLTAYAYLFIMEEQKAQQGSGALQVEMSAKLEDEIRFTCDGANCTWRNTEPGCGTIMHSCLDCERDVCSRCVKAGAAVCEDTGKKHKQVEKYKACAQCYFDAKKCGHCESKMGHTYEQIEKARVDIQKKLSSRMIPEEDRATYHWVNEVTAMKNAMSGDHPRIRREYVDTLVDREVAEMAVRQKFKASDPKNYNAVMEALYTRYNVTLQSPNYSLDEMLPIIDEARKLAGEFWDNWPKILDQETREQFKVEWGKAKGNSARQTVIEALAREAAKPQLPSQQLGMQDNARKF